MVSKISFKLYLIILFALILLSSCRKKEESEEIGPTTVEPEKPLCKITSITDSITNMHEDYIYKNDKLLRIISYSYDSAWLNKHIIYDEEGKKIREEYYTYHDTTISYYNSYTYNSVGHLISVSQTNNYPLIGETLFSHIYVYDLKNRVVRVEQVSIFKEVFSTLHLIYDEYDNIVDIRNCIDGTCEPYISYEYDYTLKASPDSDYRFLLGFSPNHFIKRKIEYFDYKKVHEVYYIPIKTDTDGKILKMGSYSDGDLEHMCTYQYNCD